MFAPPGVDSDDSSGEDDLPDTSAKAPPAKPSFSLRTLLSPTKLLGKAAEKGKAAEPAPTEITGPLIQRPPTPPKKRVRIRIDGEDSDDEHKKLDLLEAPIGGKVEEQEGETPESTVGEEMAPRPSSPLVGRPTNGEPRNDVGDLLSLLRQVLAESTAASRPPSPPLRASLQLVNDEGEDDDSPDPQPEKTLLDDAEAGRLKKKPSRLGKWSKLTKLGSSRPTAQDQSPLTQVSSAFPPGKYPRPPSRPTSTTYPNQTHSAPPNPNAGLDGGQIYSTEPARPMHGLAQEYYNAPSPGVSQAPQYSQQHPPPPQHGQHHPPPMLYFPGTQSYQPVHPTGQQWSAAAYNLGPTSAPPHQSSFAPHGTTAAPQSDEQTGPHAPQVQYPYSSSEPYQMSSAPPHVSSFEMGTGSAGHQGHIAPYYSGHTHSVHHHPHTPPCCAAALQQPPHVIYIPYTPPHHSCFDQESQHRNHPSHDHPDDQISGARDRSNRKSDSGTASRREIDASDTMRSKRSPGDIPKSKQHKHASHISRSADANKAPVQTALSKATRDIGGEAEAHRSGETQPTGADDGPKSPPPVYIGERGKPPVPEARTDSDRARSRKPVSTADGQAEVKDSQQSPQKLDLDQMDDMQRRQVEAMLKHREAEKGKSTVSKGGSSPKQVEEAVYRAATERAVTDGHVDTSAEKLEARLAHLREKRDRIGRKVKTGDVSSEEAALEVQKLNAEIDKVKKAVEINGTKTSPPEKLKQQSTSVVTKASVEKSKPLDSPAQNPRSATVTGRDDHLKARVESEDEAPETKREGRARSDRIVAELEKNKNDVIRVKDQLTKGVLDKDKGGTELKRLMTERERLKKRSSNPAAVVMSDKLPSSASSAVAGSRATEPNNMSPLEENKRAINNVNVKIHAGKLSKDEGSKLMKKLLKQREELKTSATSAGKGERSLKPDQASSSRADPSSRASRSHVEKAGGDLETNKQSIIDVKRRMADGTIDEVSGGKLLKKLAKAKEELKASTETPPSKRDPTGAEPPPSAKALGKRSVEQAPKSADDTEKRLEANKAKMIKIQDGIKAGKFDKSQGDQMLKKLMAERQTLKQMTSKISTKTKQEVDAPAASKKAEKEGGGDINEKLEENKKRMIRLKEKIAEGKVDKAAGEKEMAKMSQEREELKAAAASAKAKPMTPQVEQPSQPESEEPLDPEILKEILGETRSSVKMDGTGTEGDQIKRQASPPTPDEQVPRVPGGFPSPKPIPKGPQPFDLSGPPDSTAPSRTTSSGHRSSQTPGRTVNPSDTTLTWSKCLLSLVSCIDLANDLLAHLMASHRGRRLSQDSPLLVEILPRLLTSLLMQRDIVSTMKDVFGQEHTHSLTEFIRHVNVIRKYLAIQQEKRAQAIAAGEDKNLGHFERKAAQAFEYGSLEAVLEHILHLSEYITPEMLKAVQSLLRDWTKDGFSIKSAIHAIFTIRQELSRSTKSKDASSASHSPPEPARGMMNILEQLLQFLHTDAKADSRGMVSGHNADSSRAIARGAPAATKKVQTTAPSPAPPEHRVRERISTLADRMSERLSSSGRSALKPEDIQQAKQRSDKDRSDGDSRRLTKKKAEEQIADRVIHPHQQESVVVTPPGLTFGSEGTAHEVRRPSAWSSDSHYSDQEDEASSEGTIDSDDEARELLAKADSGPRNFEKEDLDEEKEQERIAEEASPSDDQVKRAREVMGTPAGGRAVRVARV